MAAAAGVMLTMPRSLCSVKFIDMAVRSGVSDVKVNRSVVDSPVDVTSVAVAESSLIPAALAKAFANNCGSTPVRFTVTSNAGAVGCGVVVVEGVLPVSVVVVVVLSEASVLLCTVVSLVGVTELLVDVFVPRGVLVLVAEAVEVDDLEDVAEKVVVRVVDGGGAVDVT